ncbi:MAG: glycerophosphodiester phosphodiesterase, partial [Promethearchaeota archaeon]
LLLPIHMWKVSKNPFIKNFRPLVMAHRGDSANIPENTIQSFEDAYNASVDCIETDIHLTKDKYFIFFHDNKLDRTTNGEGKISDFNLDELKKFDAGYKFEKIEINEHGNEVKTFPFRDKGYKIRAIHEILPMFPIRFNLDIKDSDPAAPDLLANVLHSLKVEDRVIIGSFHQSQIKKFRQSAPDIATSAGPKEVVKFWRKSRKSPKKKATLPNYTAELTTSKDVYEERQIQLFGKPLPYAALQIPEGYYFLRIVSPEFIHFAHYLGIAIHVWTINDAKIMQKLLDWNVDGIFTDTPRTLLDVVKNR